MKVGVGDSSIDAGSNLIWEEITKESKMKHSEYKWTMTVPGTHERRTFIWKRTRNFGLESTSAKWASTNFKLIDPQTDEIVANFANNSIKQWKKMGKFVIRAQYGEEWEFMVLLTALAIIEKARRRERLRSAGKSDGS
ncbi:hypothetical protein DL98DRAFT_523109 [Cadophora sp. DSE1049]|nr:hypothetical protein DL98DRAFT_523109 [Cadophora sp. DSE1049]